MPLSLSQWLDYQSSLHSENIALDLSRACEVWHTLKAPRIATKVITVGGTNGKGSCVALLNSMLRSAGYSVGCYTSPHLLSYNERVSLNGELVDDATLCDAFDKVEKARGDVPLTYYEFGTLAALWIFSQRDLQIALLEVGLGGRLDTVNIIDTDIALITGIAFDHMEWLGDTLELIGAEKAGIFRADKPAIYASLEMPDSIAATAQAVGAKLLRLGVNYHYQTEQDMWHWFSDHQTRRALPLPNLRGAVQLRNAAAAIQAIECLQPSYSLTQSDIRQGLLSVELSGRMTIHQRNARWVLDVAHNAEAVTILAQQVRQMFVPGKVVAIVGLLQDKLQANLLEPLLEKVDLWYLVDLSDEFRGASASQVQKVLPGKNVTLCEKPQNAFDWVDKYTHADDLVLVFGSFITVAAAMRWMT